MTGSPKWKIGTLDLWKALTVALYVGASALIVSLLQAIQAADFSSVDLAIAGLHINGTVLATLVVNVLVYLGKLLSTDTAKQ